MVTHPALNSTATLNTVLGAVNLLLTFLLCITIGASMGFTYVDPSMIALLFCGGVLLIFVAPGVCLMCCAGHIRSGSKTAVTVALVVASLTVLLYSLGVIQGVFTFARYIRWFGTLPPAGAIVFFWFNAILFAGFLIDVIKLARCYGAINRLGLSGQRGFEPLMPRGQSSAAPDAAPQGDEWPDITN